MKKTVKCIFCSKTAEITRSGNVKPHIVHKGKQCIGNGANANQMIQHRVALELLRVAKRAK